MDSLVLAAGGCLLAASLYTLSDPLSRSRNWVPPDAWERDPEAARKQQRQRARLVGVVLAALGLVILVVGLT